MQTNIRNFTIIGHIDHGKSTLADRLLEITGTITAREARPQFLDKLAVERERGITIKLQTARMKYQNFILNLIDTPGHVDFSYEVSRALAACEGAILLIDATQGIQAQTLSYFQKAKAAQLKIIPAINKIDLPQAQVEETIDEIVANLGFDKDEILCLSGKTGQGVEALLGALIERVPPPRGNVDKPLRALIFDSFFQEHKGVVALIKVVDGQIDDLGQSYEFMVSQTTFKPIEAGYLEGSFVPGNEIKTGEVGYVATGIKDIRLGRVGDTITQEQNLKDGNKIKPLPGYQSPKPMVFAELFPLTAGEYPEFKKAVEKLALNDGSLSYRPINRPFLGAGFHCGFLGLLHLEVTTERLQREFNVATLSTVPTPAYEDGQEPWVKIEIVTPTNYLSNLLSLIERRRGIFKNLKYLTSSGANQSSSCIIQGELPFSELISDFFDELKSLSQGYASLDYEFLDYRPASLVKLNILVCGGPIEPLSRVVFAEKAEKIGREMVERLKDLIPPHQFVIPIQAAIGGKIIARSNISPLRKNVLAKMSGGHRERKDKLLEKQKNGKERLKRFGKVDIPSNVFLSILKKN